VSQDGGPAQAAPSSRGRWLVVARIAFLIAVVGFGWLWLRDDWDDVVAAMREVSPAAVALSLVLVLGGLVLTGFVWVRCLRRFGHDVPLPPALSVFFVGQLGKYIPGSVWSLGAQAQMATRYGVPARTTVAAGLVFLGWNVVTAGAVTSMGVLLGAIPAVPRWVGAIGLVVSLVCMTPRVVGAAGSWAAGGGRRLALTARDCALIAALLLVTWALYGLALHAVSPGSAGTSYGVGDAMVAFTAAYAVGVLVILAPAGLGAREAVLTLLLTPFLGVGGAAAAALLTRLVHTAADFSIAGAAWLLGRRAA
jgi:uncharacterized membrane protein YbhN (UPF0104 family)